MGKRLALGDARFASVRRWIARVRHMLPCLMGIALLALAGCEGGAAVSGSDAASPSVNSGLKTAALPVAKGGEYRLGPGDKLRLQVLADKDLSRDYEVDGSGAVSIGLIGTVKAAGLTVREFEELVKKELRNGYIRDPKVTVEVVSYRPFYIIGEVNKPGEYPYKAGVNVVSAVAIAGGYTYRGNTNYVLIRRAGSSAEQKVQATPDVLIQAGDMVRVPERYF